MGARDASITKAVFELPPLKNVYVIDIKIPDKIYIPISQYIKTGGKAIKLDHKIDLITCFQSLHHM